jgi:hypothetical protein
LSEKNDYLATPANIENEYKRYARKGRPHKHWLGQFNQLRKENRLPSQWLYLTTVPKTAWDDEVLASMDRASKEYWSSEHSQDLKRAQKKFSESPEAAAARKRGGVKSGSARRLNRDDQMKAIVKEYRTANQLPQTFKPNARDVANWYVQQMACNIDSLARRLRAARVAE